MRSLTRNAPLGALIAALLLTAPPAFAADTPPPSWSPSSEAPEGLLTPLEIQRHDMFIELARTASACTGSPSQGKCTPGGIDIVFFGRTMTEMWWWPDRGRPVWEKAFADRRAVNFGSQGSRPESLLWRMRHGELDGYKARLVVLQALQPLPAASGRDLAAAYAPLLAEIRARQPEAKILIVAGSPQARAADHAAIVDNRTIFYAQLDEPLGSDTRSFELRAAALEPWLERLAG